MSKRVGPQIAAALKFLHRNDSAVVLTDVGRAAIGV